ncbi:Aste57867_22137 [Aphanomyces stellatus]|uniref:Aste57867_22137 protein n=1 Tax=Aphanomyces stellatus TaxID=120398 RepID=A0A485LK29_9STRA|nr:hypothetical protein As57867_022068 [Aphanomyces stellatus]VFT98805.1 Aste57867_22137 [Aphanomyces stellatus]
MSPATTHHDVMSTPALIPSKSPPRSNRRGVWAGLLVCGALCMVTLGAVLVFHHKTDNRAPAVVSALQQTSALKLTLHLKRGSMHFNNQDTAVAYVMPRASNSDGEFAFDAVMRLDLGATTETYTLVDGRAFVTRSERTTTNDDDDAATSTPECLEPSQMFPFHLMQSSLTSARVIDRVVLANDDASSATTLTTATDCVDGTLLELSFAGESFVLCNDKFNQPQWLKGTDVDIAIESLSSSSLPAFASSLDKSASVACTPVTPSLPPAASPRSWTDFGTDVVQVLSGAPREAGLAAATCGCRMEKKPCLFVHGLANPLELPLSNSFVLWWGQVHRHAPCCSSIKFTHFDTINQAWTSDKLQHDFCDAALTVSGASANATTPNTIGSLLLVSHSMGNLIVSGAVATNKCQLSSDVTWISSAAPLRGSKSANLFESICDDDHLGGLLNKPLKLLHLCPAGASLASMYYYDTMSATAQAQYDAAQAVRRRHATKMICGTDGWGLNTVFAPPFKLVGELSHHDGPNDGLVSLESCTAGVGLDNFGGTTESFNYLAKINHLDCAFREGDGWWGADRKPVKWFECAL